MGTKQEELRTDIVEYAKELNASGLVIGTAGNISARVGPNVLITPSGHSYAHMVPTDVCLVDCHGQALCPDTALAQSSETPLHLALYAGTEAGAVVHFHGLHSTAVATAARSLPVIHYYALRLGGEIRVAPYSMFGSARLASDVAAAMVDRRAALMANHGAVAIGVTVADAYANAVLLEWLCQLHTIAYSFGNPRRLTEREIDAVRHRYASRG